MATTVKAPEKRRSGIFRRFRKSSTSKSQKKAAARDVPVSETSSARSIATKESSPVAKKAATSGTLKEDTKALIQKEQAPPKAVVEEKSPKPTETTAIVAEKDAAPASYSYTTLRNASIVATVIVAVGVAALFKFRKH